MDVTLPEEQVLLRDTLRRFAGRELEPVAGQVEDEAKASR